MIKSRACLQGIKRKVTGKKMVHRAKMHDKTGRLRKQEQIPHENPRNLNLMWPEMTTSAEVLVPYHTTAPSVVKFQ